MYITLYVKHLSMTLASY